LLGDTLYGGDGEIFPRQALHAYKYSFCHPFTQEIVTVKAPLPEDLIDFITSRKWDLSSYDR
jgi:23S rRNA pseudouridine1911/1915/1917 synthase